MCKYNFLASIGFGPEFDSPQLQVSRDKPSRGDTDFDRLSQNWWTKKKNCNGKVLFYGKDENADFRFCNEVITPKGTTFDLIHNNMF